MSYTIEDVIKRYIELRDEEAALSEKHKLELQPIAEKMGMLESYLMNQMNKLGCDQLKANGVGTAYKHISTSVKMDDPTKFKQFVFEPVAASIMHYLNAAGAPTPEHAEAAILNILRDLPRWDVVDFRAGKKGVQEYQQENNQPVPGTVTSSIQTIQIRRA